jgi:dephospho-CoA kinase
MLSVGLTGGYATGKSFVAAEFERLGCTIISADRLGHQVLLPGGEAYAPTIEAFGPGILGSDGIIDRKKLGAVVFSSPELLAKLSSFVHPAVFHLEERMLAETAARHPDGIAILEAAILVETGRFARFDRLILTVCDLETQIARGIKRDGLTREQVLDRINRQMPVEEKKKYAHYVIDTSGSKADTASRVGEIFRELKELAAAQSS